MKALNLKSTRNHRKMLGKLGSNQGFTLIEIMVVVVILSILAAVVVPKIMEQPDEARIVKARQDIRAIQSALQLYKLNNFQYPTTEQGLNALVEKPSIDPEPKNWKNGGYLAKAPKDPWGNEYQYLSPGANGDMDLYSMGPDQTAQTEDDIGNWNLDD